MDRASVATSMWPDMLGGVVSESRRVVAAHSRHFLALSVLFLLPLSSLLVAAPSLLFSSSAAASAYVSSSYPTSLLLRFHLHRPSAAAGFVALYYSAALLLFLSAAAAVSSSVHRGFYGRPVKLLPALRSLPAPLARLLLTLVAALLPVAAFLLLLASLLVLSLKALTFLHLPPSFSPLTCSSLFAAIAVLGLLLLHLNWSLAGSVAILESSWGFSPLRRSADLIKGMRLASLCSHLFFAAAIGLTLWGCSKAGRTEREWRELVPVVARTVFATGITTVLLLYWMVTGVVMYMYCKALHGELAGEIAEEFACEYVSLPFDERKVPHVVSVIHQ